MSRRKQSKPTRCNSDKKAVSSNFLNNSTILRKWSIKNETNEVEICQPFKKLKPNLSTLQNKEKNVHSPSTSWESTTEPEALNAQPRRIDKYYNIKKETHNSCPNTQSNSTIKFASHELTNNLVHPPIKTIPSINYKSTNSSLLENQFSDVGNFFTALSPSAATLQLPSSLMQVPADSISLPILKMLASIVENGKLNEKINQEVALMISTLLPTANHSKHLDNGLEPKFTSKSPNSEIRHNNKELTKKNFSVSANANNTFLKRNSTTPLSYISKKQCSNDHLSNLNQQVENLEKTLTLLANPEISTPNTNISQQSERVNKCLSTNWNRKTTSNKQTKLLNTNIKVQTEISKNDTVSMSNQSMKNSNDCGKKMQEEKTTNYGSQHNKKNVQNGSNESLPKISFVEQPLISSINTMTKNQVNQSINDPSQSSSTSETGNSNPLNKLSEFVANLGPNNKKKMINEMNPQYSIEAKSNNNRNHFGTAIFDSIFSMHKQQQQKIRDCEISSHSNVLKCTICSKCYNSLDELAHHKRKTGHMSCVRSSSQPKSTNMNLGTNKNYSSFPPGNVKLMYDGFLQTALSNKYASNLSLLTKTNFPIIPENESNKSFNLLHNISSISKKQSVANAIGRRGHFGFSCTLCGFTSMNTPVAVHMTTAHSFRNPSEWREAVILIPVHK